MLMSTRTIDLTNKFYRNVDVETEVANKLLTESIKRSMEEHALYNSTVTFSSYEYDSVIGAVKYIFKVAKEQGVLDDKFLSACLSDNYKDITMTNGFKVNVSDYINHEFNISPQKPGWLNRASRVRFHLPHGTQNQNASVEKLLAVIESTTRKGTEVRFANYSPSGDERIVRLNYNSMMQDNAPPKKEEAFTAGFKTRLS